MNLLTILPVFYILPLVHIVEPQAQPCLICGDSVLRIWSLMSRVGDRYLRISNNNGNRNHKIIDCAGGIQNDNFTSLLKIREKSTFQETRIQLVLARNNKQYHLYAPSTSGTLLAMPASEGEQETDHRNTWAPERLLYEHRLFTVFQSVKFRGYYLSCDGSGKAVLQQIVNKAYRQPNQLFITIDPGSQIRGVSFGSGNAAGRRKREISMQEDANPQAGIFYVPPPRTTKFRSWRTRKQRPYPFTQFRPRPYYNRKPPTSPKYSSVMTNFNLPLNITFVLCFWIKTEARFAQLISVTEKLPEKEPVKQAWYRRFTYWSQPKQNTKDNAKNIINVSILQRMLTLELGYKRTKRNLPNCDVSDGKFHQICISLNGKYLLEVYQDSEVLLSKSLPGLARDFENRNNQKMRRGSLMLGQTRGMKGQQFDGSLFQVNLWDQYPSFRIKRIATNCACGGGSLVQWSDLLNGTMSRVRFDDNSQCPKLEGYDYDEITQNRLI